MLKRKYLSYLGLFTMLFPLASCEVEAKKFEDTDNNLYYSQVKGKDYYSIKKYIDDLPSDVVIRGEVDDVPVSGFYLDGEEYDWEKIKNGKSDDAVKHVTFEPSNRFNSAIPFPNALDMTFPDTGNFTVSSSSKNLKKVNTKGANLTLSLSSDRSVDLNVEGGLVNCSSSLGTIKLKKNSSVVTFSTSSENTYPLPCAINNIAVFEEGYDFTDDAYCSHKHQYYLKKVFQAAEQKDYCLPFASTIYLPKTITNISDLFFGDVSYNDDKIVVHYEGTEEEWKKINISNINNDNYFKNDKVTVIYNSVYQE